MSRVLKNYENQITQKYNAKTHKGIDIVGYKAKTDYIIAHSDGVVVEVVNNYNKTDKTGNSYGNYIKIKHNNGYYTLYAHLKYKHVYVNVGDKVKQGDTIAYMGNTGHSTASHLHFEVRNEKDVRIDPTKYIDSDLPQIWTIGNYKLLYAKVIRTSCSVSLLNRVKVKQCMASVKPKLTSNKPNDIAKIKAGEIVKVTEIILKDNRVWGKLSNSYIVLCNNDGSPQATLVLGE